MKYATHCKFCKIPITLEIDDGYDLLGDPQKLIPLACCNHCSDVRVKRRNLETSLQQQCYSIQLLNSAKSPIPEKARGNLAFLAKEYAKMVADWNKTKGMAYDEAIVDALLEQPQRWGQIIGRLWRMHANWRQRQAGQT